MNELKILYLEDSAQDAELAGHMLKSAGINFKFRLVDTQDEYQDALKDYKPDLVLADHSLFHFNSLEALKIFKATGLKVPFILVTGTVSEEFAVNILKQGADDYLLKDNLVRLPSAILNSLEKYHIESERQKYLNSIIANETLMKEAERLAYFGSWEMDPISGEIIWSDGIYHVLGYEPGEIKPGHDTILRHIHPEDRLSYQQIMYSYLANHDSYSSEMRIINKKNIAKNLFFKIVVSRDPEGRPIRILGFFQDITEKRNLEKELSEQALRQQKLITEVTIQAQEKERNEIGRELHDNVNQILATIKMYLGMSLERPERKDDLIRRSLNNVNYAIEEIRRLSRSLVAPTLGDLGLIHAMQDLADEINFEGKLEVKLIHNINPERSLGNNMELMLYRITQEQLSNIRKYANATKAIITVQTEENKLLFSITDNGVGFDVAKKATGIGLKNISSRVDFYSGSLDIISSPGKGCSLNIIIPLQ